MAVALIFSAAILAGSAYLFTGSQVTCEELTTDSAPWLSCVFDVGAAPDAVWSALTRTGEPRPYYFDAILEADMRPGGRWRFLTDDRERLLADGELLVIEPLRRLEQSFRAADLDDPPSRIVVDLEPTGTGCRVSLTHDRFQSRTTTYRRFRRAHPLALSALKAFVETGELPFRARLYTWIFKPGMKTFTVRAEPAAD